MRAARTLAASLLVTAVGACGTDASAPHGPPAARTFRMGFSDFPPSPDTALAVRALDMQRAHADAAIMHLEPPWTALLAGTSPDSLVASMVVPLATLYRSWGLVVAIELDVTDPIDRTQEAPALTAVGRSITDTAVQHLYRAYARSVAVNVPAAWYGLASETNLIRAQAPAGVYAAVAQMTTAAAADIRSAGVTAPLYVSVQVDVAWGHLTGSGAYVGIAQDLHDFAFATAIGMSSYPYLAGYADPTALPADYYARIAQQASGIPVLMTEGGWTSASIGRVVSSTAEQARWIARAASLLDSAHAVAWFQLDFTDLDLAAFGYSSTDPSVAPFAAIGLVDSALVAKPALAAWDSVLARPWRATGD